MAVMRWDPLRDLIAMQNEFNRLFERTFSKGETGVRVADWVPAVDMFERDDAFIVRVELPGIKAEDVNISIVDDHLNIHGEKKFKEEIKEQSFYRVEQRYGSFERVIQLPVKVNTEDIKATFSDGVLEIAMSKAEDKKPKQIKISINEDDKID